MARQGTRVISLIKALAKLLLLLSVGCVLTLVAAVVWTFEVKLRSWPLFVHSAGFAVRVGDDASEIKLLERLTRLGYVRSVSAVPQPGQWAQVGAEITVFFRYCPIDGEAVVAGPVSFSLDGDRVRSIRLMRSYEQVDRVTLEPELIRIVPPDGKTPELCRGVPLAKIPSLLVDAILLTEDSRFLSHHGIDLASIRQALKTNIREGRYVQGGSTITQQLVRMTVLSPKKTMGRKVAEILMSLAADGVYSKERILEAYLNRVYFGQWGQTSVKGVAEAARIFFGKNLAELDAAECALLAATIRAPNIINPVRHPERARSRRNMVLGLLLKAGKISAETCDEALNGDTLMARGTPATTRAPTFMDMVKALIPRDVPGSGRDGGRQDVVTSHDALLQHEALLELRNFGEAGAQGHVIVAHPPSGEILALVSPSGSHAWSGTGGSPELALPFMTLRAMMPDRQELPQYTLTSPFVVPGETNRRMTWREMFYRDRPFIVAVLSSTVEAGKIVATLKDFGLEARTAPGTEVVMDPASPMNVAQSYALLASLGSAGTLGPRLRVCNGSAPATPVVMKHASVKPAVIYLVNHLLIKAAQTLNPEGALQRDRPVPSAFVARDRDGVWGIAYHAEALAVLRLPAGARDDRRVEAAILRLLPRRNTVPQSAPYVPNGVLMRHICRDSGMRATSLCRRVLNEAFLKGTQPAEWCPLQHELVPTQPSTDK